MSSASRMSSARPPRPSSRCTRQTPAKAVSWTRQPGTPLPEPTTALTSPCPSDSLSARSAPGGMACSENRGAPGAPGRWPRIAFHELLDHVGSRGEFLGRGVLRRDRRGERLRLGHGQELEAFVFHGVRTGTECDDGNGEVFHGGSRLSGAGRGAGGGDGDDLRGQRARSRPRAVHRRAPGNRTSRAGPRCCRATARRAGTPARASGARRTWQPWHWRAAAAARRCGSLRAAAARISGRITARSVTSRKRIGSSVKKSTASPEAAAKRVEGRVVEADGAVLVDEARDERRFGGNRACDGGHGEGLLLRIGGDAGVREAGACGR